METNQARYFTPAVIPITVHSDSYKFTHPSMFPEAEEMSAYIEARKPYEGGEDHRIVHYGSQYLVERWLMRQWTEEDVEYAEEFFETFNAGGTPYPFPRDLFMKFIHENDGWFPVKVESLADGTVIYARTPQMVLTASGEYSRLVTWIETVALQTIWYMSTVATHSRLTMTTIRNAFEHSVDQDAWWKLGSRFHDFGFRGCTSTEQAIMGGASHLLNSDGTDTTVAAYYVQYWLNKGNPVGSSIPATEHSVMTAWDSEFEAVSRVIDEFGAGVFATVADSYDYQKFLDELLPQVAPRVRKAGGFHVVRPDSGDPVQCVVDGLQALDRAYGSDVNDKGFKVIRGAGIIQGDGINRHTVSDILEAAMDAGFSAENCAFGMGAGLLQRLNRDTLGYACKLSYIRDLNGERNVMKVPETDFDKASLPGRFSVRREWFDREMGVHSPVVFPGSLKGTRNLLKVMYDCGPVDYAFEVFDGVRARVDREWNALPKQAPVGPWSPELIALRESEIRRVRGQIIRKLS